MAKVNLQLGATIDTASADEIRDVLAERDSRARRDAVGFKIMDFPLMQGKVDGSGNLALGGDQPDQILAGPKQGFVWAVHRVSVFGFKTSSEQVSLFKGSNKFVCNLLGTTAMVTFSKGAFNLLPGDFLRVTGSSLSAGEQLSVYWEGFNVPAPMIIKLS